MDNADRETNNRSNAAVLFPGSGAQYVGMMKKVWETSEIVRETFAQADDHLGVALSEIIMRGNTLKLNRLENMLPAIFVSSVAYYRLLRTHMDPPRYLSGHSLGEYAALVCGGALSFTDGLSLVVLRSRLAAEVAQKTDSGMAILKNICWRTVQEVCEQVQTEADPVSIACFNSRTQVSISGTESALRKVERSLLSLDENVQVIHLLGSAPFHGILMKERANELHQALSTCEIKNPECPVIANVTATPYKTPDDIADGLTRQLYSAVKWEQTIAYLLERKIDALIDIGPQNMLKNILVEADAPVSVYAYDEKLDQQKLKDSIKVKATPKNDGVLYGKAIDLCLMHATTLKNYSPGNQLMTEARKQYRQIAQTNEQIKKQEVVADKQKADDAFQMLKKVFEAKAVPPEEQEKRCREIICACYIEPNTLKQNNHLWVVDISER